MATLLIIITCITWLRFAKMNTQNIAFTPQKMFHTG